MAASRRTIAVGCAFALTLASSATTLTALGAEQASEDTAFSLAGTLGQAASGPVAVSLPDGGALIVGGKRNGTDALRSTERWDPASAEFSGAGNLTEARANHTATLLSDGRVLVIGGDDGSDPIASAELWDPATGSFIQTDSLGRARSNHTATRLPDGRVLVIGGDGEEDDVGLAELWDPADETFSSAGNLSVARSDHTATVLSDGRVLVAGGLDDGYSDPTATAELWDPEVGDFEPAASLSDARYWHTATPLADGRVLIAGGLGTNEVRLASAELWDPGEATFGPAGMMHEARGGHAAARLADGRVLVAGGLGEDGRLDSAEVWGLATTASVASASPAPSRRALETELAESMGWASWAPYRKSPAGAAYDPFQAGAKAGVIFDGLERELHRTIDYIVLFRFPDASSLDAYWSERAAAAASVAPPREAPCRNGRPGQGRWNGGEYLCYVSDTGAALLRWTDERTDTYGVMNAGPGRTNLETLFGQWQRALRGPEASPEPSPTASPGKTAFGTAERLLLRGVPARIKATCVPARQGIPAGTVAAVECTSADSAVGSVTYHLMEKTKASRAFSRQVRKAFGGDTDGFGLWRCEQGEPGWEPSIPYGSDACVFGGDGLAQLRIVGGVTSGCTQLKVAGKWLREPVVYMIVEGVDHDLAALFEAVGSGGGRLWHPITQKGAPPSDMCPH